MPALSGVLSIRPSAMTQRADLLADEVLKSLLVVVQ